MYSEQMPSILLVDDDPLHASVRKAILERKYPSVTRVNDAAEALGLLERSQSSNDLAMVVTNDQHAGIGLANFISELHLRMPRLPILVIAEKDTIQGDFSDCPVTFVQRPVTAEDLLSAVAGLMNRWTPSRLKTA